MAKSTQKIVETLIDAGIDYTFGLPGGATMSIYDALYDVQDKIHSILPRDEQAASCMADMYGRLTGKPGVFIAQGGFASSTGLFGIIEAYLSSSPMLVLTEVSEYGCWINHGCFQNGGGEYGGFDTRQILKSCTKYTVMPINPIDAVQGVQFAIKHAMTGKPGPCACVFRAASFSGEIDEEINPRLHDVRGYLNVSKPAAREEDMITTRDLLLGAKNPVILSGNGVHRSRAMDELRELAELTGIPVATSYLGKNTFSEIHSLSLGVMGNTGHPLANDMIGEADMLLIIGCSLKPNDTVYQNPKVINPDRQKIVQIDIDGRNTAWTFPIKSGLSITADAKEALKQLLAKVKEKVEIEKKLEDLPRVKKLIERKKKEHHFEDSELYSDMIPIHPERIVGELREILEPSTIVVADAGNNRAWMCRYFPVKTAGTYFKTGGLFGVSWALPGALAAKLLMPDTPVVGVVSDGGFAMQQHVLLTAAQYSIPAIYVVMNNSALGMVLESQGGRALCSEFSDVNFAKIAEASGCLGIRVERPDEIRPAMTRALKSGRPAVVDIVTAKDVDCVKKLQSPLVSEINVALTKKGLYYRS